MKCFKCGKEKETINHHISYNPEKIVDCCRSCHKKIHNRVRENDLCPLSVAETRRISMKLSGQREENIKKRREYTKNNRTQIYFYQSIGKNAGLCETLYYNFKTGNVGYSSFFKFE